MEAYASASVSASPSRRPPPSWRATSWPSAREAVHGPRVADAKIEGVTRTLFAASDRCPTCSPRTTGCAKRERQAMNAGIQGLAADIFKLALVRSKPRHGGG